jgi:photosystem II stability/assembly factor-like uncharacterized protein
VTTLESTAPHDDRSRWLFVIELLVSATLVSALFYVAFFVKLEAEVIPYQETPFGSRDNYYGLTMAPDDYKVLWAVGRGGKVIKTENSGNDWSIQTSATSNHLQSIASKDSQTAIAIGDLGTIMTTSDGGNTWQLSTAELRDFGDQLLRVYFDPLGEAWITGSMGTVLHSADNGQSWTMRHEEEDLAWNSVTRTADGTVWIVGEFGQAKYSKDAGETWEIADLGLESSLMDITFSDDMNGVAVGLTGTIIVTFDGGQTWQGYIQDDRFTSRPYSVTLTGEMWQHDEKQNGISSHLYSIIWTGQEYITIGDGGFMVIGKDNGQNWYPQTLGKDSIWYTSLAANNGKVYISGNNLAAVNNGLYEPFRDK